MTERLEITGGGSLSAFKASPSDPADGIAFGKYLNGALEEFAFVAGRTAASGVKQEILLSPERFRILNAQFKVTGEAAPTPVIRTTNLSVTNLPTGIRRIRLSALGGGGGGSAGDPTMNSGGNGGNTIVTIYDGATVKHTFTANGGAGGSSWGGTGDGNGQNSAFGAGGEVAPFYARTSAGAATGYGAGGGGGGSDPGYEQRGRGGLAGQTLDVDWVDLSTYTTPRIAITIGSGGVGGSGASFGAGSPFEPSVALPYVEVSDDVEVDPLRHEIVNGELILRAALNEDLRSSMLEQIKAARGAARARFITVLPGQDMVYLAKEAEARAWLADPAPDLADYPMIAAEIPTTGQDGDQVAQVWANIAAFWRAVSIIIEAATLTADGIVRSAETVAAAEAVIGEMQSTLASLV